MSTIRLPTIGGDDGTWGTVLNGFLNAHAGLDSAKEAAAADNNGEFYFSTDISGGTLYQSNGTTWTALARGLTQAPVTHQASHQAGGGDALSGSLDASARVAVKKAGTTTGTRRGINFIEGTNITVTETDQAGSEHVDVTITAASGGASLPMIIALA